MAQPSGLLDFSHRSRSSATCPVASVIAAVGSIVTSVIATIDSVVTAVVAAIGSVVTTIIAAPFVALVADPVVVPVAIARRREVAITVAVDHHGPGVSVRTLVVATLIHVHRHRAP